MACSVVNCSDWLSKKFPVLMSETVGFYQLYCSIHLWYQSSVTPSLFFFQWASLPKPWSFSKTNYIVLGTETYKVSGKKTKIEHKGSQWDINQGLISMYLLNDSFPHHPRVQIWQIVAPENQDCNHHKGKNIREFCVQINFLHAFVRV